MNKDWRKGSVQDDEGRFCNPWTNLPFPPNFTSLMKWVWNAKTPSLPSPAELKEMFPVVKTEWTKVLQSSLSLTWIGHASCYLTMAGGLRILTDPIFSERASPVQFTGPKRFVPPSCPITEVPMPHLILISHDHYDHLDYNSVRELEARAVKEGDIRPIYCVGLGLKDWFSSFVNDTSRIIELDWWQSKEIASLQGGVRVEFVPVQHWCSRSHLDRCCRLWGGWIVTDSDGKKFFFAGDTGLNEEVFEEIGSRHGPIDLSAIPIGAYEPRWFMHPQHVSPEQAVRIHELVKSKRSIGIHWGTFILTDEPIDEPKKLLDASTGNCKYPFTTCHHGETVFI